MKLVASLLALFLFAATAGAGQLADVFLKSGLRLRGEVTETKAEVTIRNAAGSISVPRDQIERIVPVAERPESQPTAPPPVPATAPAAPASRPTTAATSEDPSANVEPAPAEQDSNGGLAAPPLVTPHDIIRLKLAELRLDDPAEELRAKFLRKPGEADLIKQVHETLSKRTDYDPEWGKILNHGQPYEKLRLIVRTTGLEHADRIEVPGDPAVFGTFRRRVLPLLTKGCARSGCHGGDGAALFRLPAAGGQSEAAVYTSFVILDQLETGRGPVLDRMDPEGAPLTRYLLSIEDDPAGHPAVNGKRILPTLRTTRDPQYAALIAWINSLRTPRPDYGLRYQNPFKDGSPELKPQSQPGPGNAEQQDRD